MKRRAAKWLTLLLLLAIGALSALPASWLSLPLERATEGRWRLSKASGTVWDGATQLVFLGEGGEVLAMSALAWHWQPKALLQGKLAWLLDSDGQPGRLLLGWGRQEVAGVAFQLPAAALANLSKTWQAARLGGELNLQLAQLVRQDGQWNGGLQLSWRGAASPLTSVLPFGSYQLDAAANGNAVLLNVATQEGPLMINGQGQWQPGGALQLAGMADSPPEKYDALKPLLLMLGQPSGPTSVSWQVKPGA